MAENQDEVDAFSRIFPETSHNLSPVWVIVEGLTVKVADVQVGVDFSPPGRQGSDPGGSGVPRWLRGNSGHSGPGYWRPQLRVRGKETSTIINV